MSNITSSSKTSNKRDENITVATAYPTMLTALQDMATFFGVEIKGVYVKPNAAMNGENVRGSFYVKP